MSRLFLISVIPTLALALNHYACAQETTVNSAEQAVETTVDVTVDVPAEATPAATPVVQADSSNNYLCTLGDLQRRVEVDYGAPPAPVPCYVSYYKDTEASGSVSTLWQADNKEGYCETQAATFISKLESWGWDCNNNP